MRIKPGVKTSEFWISLMVPVLVVILNEALGWNINPEMLGGIFGLSGGSYIISRGMAKRNGS